MKNLALGAIKFCDFLLCLPPATGKTGGRDNWPTLATEAARTFKNCRDCHKNHLFHLYSSAKLIRIRILLNRFFDILSVLSVFW